MIINLFRSKPTLRELIPDGFVDIHSHILPGIDDGAKNIDETLKLISNMKEIGYSKLICTPHVYPGLYNNNPQTIKKSFEKIIKPLINIEYSAEYFMDENLTKFSENKELLTLKENYILVETSYINVPRTFEKIIFDLQINGYKPILAHPERYLYLINDFNKYYELKKRGLSFQINLLSLTGYYGNEVTKIVYKLIEKNLVDFVGSDLHNMNGIRYFSKRIKGSQIKKIENIIGHTLEIFK